MPLPTAMSLDASELASLTGLSEDQYQVDVNEICYNLNAAAMSQACKQSSWFRQTTRGEAALALAAHNYPPPSTTTAEERADIDEIKAHMGPAEVARIMPILADNASLSQVHYDRAQHIGAPTTIPGVDASLISTLAKMLIHGLYEPKVIDCMLPNGTHYKDRRTMFLAYVDMIRDAAKEVFKARAEAYITSTFDITNNKPMIDAASARPTLRQGAVGRTIYSTDHVSAPPTWISCTRKKHVVKHARFAVDLPDGGFVSSTSAPSVVGLSVDSFTATLPELTQDERDELERPFVGEVDFNPPRIEDMLQFEGIHGATELTSDFANEDVYDDAEYSVLSRFGLGKYYCGGEKSWSVSTDDLAEDDYDMEDSMSGLATSAIKSRSTKSHISEWKTVW